MTNPMDKIQTTQ